MPRLFIAINFDSLVIEKIQNICYGVKNARWIPRDQIHLTLRFLGNCESHLFMDIKAALEQIHFPAFPITISGVGFFPPRRSPRILWVGIKTSAELKNFHNLIDKHLHHLGIEREVKKFHPHITIARFKHKTNTQDIIPFIVNNSLFKVPTVTVTNFYLFSSTLHRTGAIHQIEKKYELIEPD